MDKLQVLKKYFGYSQFREHQEETIDNILAKQDILTILPTGSGKSLCYQLPALLLDGVTVVISPLIALMQDQVRSLQINNIPAEMINSSQNQEEISQVYKKLFNNQLKLLYISPERLASPEFQNTLESVNINYFVIDEAHCVSEWGHEFRADYRQMNIIKKLFPKINICAFTATATDKVALDIIKSLEMPGAKTIRGSVKRDNLTLSTKKRIGNGHEQIYEFIQDYKDDSGIIYAFSRRETESITKYLQSKGLKVGTYHAGMSNADRSAIYHDFVHDKINIVVATIAFGMGIDKSNIRYVIHSSLPKTLENYYQEIGRAGRDGLPSETLLLYNKSDTISRYAMMNDIQDSQYKSLLDDKLATAYKFANTSQCRHQFIAEYFDESITECNTVCDNCTGEASAVINITTEAQKFLSAIIRTGSSFGQRHIVNILRGSNNKKIIEYSHNNLSVFGIGKDKTSQEWDSIADKLLDINAVTFGNFRVLKLTTTGQAILKKQQEVFIEEDKINILAKPPAQNEKANINFTAYKELRNSIAQESDTPGYMILSDNILLDLARQLPTSQQELLSIDGLTEHKASLYGNKLINLAKSIIEKQGGKPPVISSNSKSTVGLTKTYLETLTLVQQGQSIFEISQTRDLQQNTIIGHISRLQEQGEISQEQAEELLTPIREGFPEAIREWCQAGLKITDIKTLRQYLAIYDVLF